jgi:hypothetical protein
MAERELLMMGIQQFDDIFSVVLRNLSARRNILGSVGKRLLSAERRKKKGYLVL